MEVILKRNVFHPQHGRFKPRVRGQAIHMPDAMFEHLPSDAVVTVPPAEDEEIREARRAAFEAELEAEGELEAEDEPKREKAKYKTSGRPTGSKNKPKA